MLLIYHEGNYRIKFGRVFETYGWISITNISITTLDDESLISRKLFEWSLRKLIKCYSHYIHEEKQP